MVDGKKANRIFKKSVEVLKEVQLRNGGCLATPKGERYPYVYPRDHAVCVMGLISASLYNRARKGLEFVLNGQLDSGAFPQRYDTKGNDASYKPIQIDGTGLTLYAIAEYYKYACDDAFILEHWAGIEKALQYIIDNIDKKTGLVYTPNSIHEFPPMEKGLEIWANAVCCAALENIGKMSGDVKKSCGDLQTTTNNIRKGILDYMWNKRTQAFVKTIRLKESSSVVTDPDISPIALSDFRVFPDSNEKVRSTVKYIEKNLWNKDLGGICRYPKYEGRNNGGWGPWPHFTLMMCKHFIKVGNRRKADKYFNWVLDIAHNNELPEHVSTVSEFEEYVTDYMEAGLLRKDRLVMIENARKHRMYRKGVTYITIPLAWPHAEFIHTWTLYKDAFG